MRDRVKNSARLLLACACLVTLPVLAGADGLRLQPGIFSDPEFDPTISFGAGVSKVSGEAHEYVYKNSGTYKLSELDWQISNMAMFNATIDARISPWLSFNITGGTKLTGSSQLDDYDWVYYGPDKWDHWSESPDTTITTANRVDVSTDLALYRQPNFSVDALAGFRWNEWEFSASGGSYIYSDANHFRTIIGTLATGAPSITYQQDFYTPYLGLGLSANFGRFVLTAKAIGSEWSFAKGHDEHFLRTDISSTGGLIEDSTHNGGYYDINLGATYKVSEFVDISAGWEREDYLLVKGGETVYAIGTGANGAGGAVAGAFGGPSGGLDNLTNRYTVGVTYKLH